LVILFITLLRALSIISSALIGTPSMLHAVCLPAGVAEAQQAIARRGSGYKMYT
jgi:hypothetical protein